MKYIEKNSQKSIYKSRCFFNTYEEIWMNANKAIEMGFCDDIMKRDVSEDIDSPSISSMYSSIKVMNHLMDKIATKAKIKGLKNDVKAE